MVGEVTSSAATSLSDSGYGGHCVGSRTVQLFKYVRDGRPTLKPALTVRILH